MDHGTDRQSIGARLRAARVKRDLTQSQLAALTGLDVGTVSRYERGATRPLDDSLAALCTALAVSSDWVLGVDGYLIGARLRAARVKRDLTQSQLAALTGLAVGTVSRYERGAARPPDDSLAALCTALAVSSDWVLGVDGYLQACDEVVA